MAKTTSQILAENKLRRAEEAAIAASRNAIHEKQMAEVEEKNKAKTIAVLQKAASNAYDTTTKNEMELALKKLIGKQPVAEEQKAEATPAASTKPKTSGASYLETVGAAQTATPYAAGLQAQQQALTPEEKAERAKKAQEAYEQQQAQMQTDEALRQKDMDEYATWSPEEQRSLEQYVLDRDAQRAGWVTDQFMTAPETKAKALIDKYGLDRVKEMAESYTRTKNKEVSEDVAKQAQEGASKSGWAAAGHSVASVGANLLDTATGTMGYVNEMFDRTGRYSTLDPHNTGKMFSTYAGNVRGTVSGMIAGDEYDENGVQTKEGGKVREGLSMLYQGGMSAADSAARILASGGSAGISAALAASGAFSQTVQEASSQGANPGQAVALGVTKAGIEYMTEKLPTEKLLKLFKGTNDVGKIASVLQQAFLVEPTSEEVSLFAGVAAEAMILKDKSNQNLKIGEMVAKGMSYEEAQKAFYKDLWNEAAQTYVTSMFSGLLSSGGAAILGGNNNVVTPEQMPVEAAPAADSGQKTIQDTAAELAQNAPQQAAEPMTDGQREVMAAMDGVLGVDKAAQKNAVSEETTVNVRSANTAITEENRAKKTLAYELATNLDSIRDMEPVSQLSGTEFKKTDDGKTISTKLREFFHSIGNKVVRNGFGDVELGEYGIGAFLTHKPINRARAVSMAAVPDVIKNGKQIGYDPDWKGRGYPSYIFAAPVEVAGTDVYVAAVVNQLPDNRFYLSEMVDSDGNYVRIEESPSGNSKNGLPMGPENQQGRGYAGPEELSEGSDPSATAEPTLLPTNSLTNNVEDVKNDSKEKVIIGTGAAEANFSGKPAYNATLAEDNAQADRADDVRPMELPAKDINGEDVSRVTGNVYASKITPDEFASLMEEPTARGDFSYAKITNDQATQRATETIASAGNWNQAYDNWKRDVAAGKAGAEMSARGALMLNYAAQQGNKQQWLETLHYMQELGTNTAQGLQAFRIIRTLNATDKIAFLQMSINKMAASIKSKYGVDIEVDNKLIEAYDNATTDEARNEALANVQQNIADQIPSTFLDKWTALRYMNMLGNLKTNVRNVAGNVGSAIVYRTKDTVATGMEALADWVSGGKVDRTKSLFVNKDLLNACKQDFNQFSETVSGGGKYGERMTAADSFEQGVMDKKTVFKSNAKDPTAKAIGDAVMKPLELYRKGTNWMMNNKYFGDEAFSRAGYSRALAGYLQANGVTGADLSKVDGALLDKARAYAIQEAQEATFHDNSKLAQIAGDIKKATGVVGEGIVPFTKTPANVLTRAVEFSPVGLIDSTVKSIQAATGKGEVTGADVINSLAKTFTGTALFALGALMYDQGLLTGGPDEDEEKAEFDKLNGGQNYALQFRNGFNYTIDWLTPAAMPAFMGAQFWKEFSKDRELTFADAEKVFTAIADPMIQMSMLQSLNDTLDSVKYVDNNFGQIIINSAVSYLTQGLTNTLVGQIERSTEQNRQTTYVDKDSQMPKWMQQTLGKASQKIPGWDFQQIDYRNAWGQTEENEGGLLYNLLSPGYLSKEESNAISQELYRLREATGAKVFTQAAAKTVSYTDKNGVVHKDYNLSAEQLQTMQQTQGETAAKVINAMISSADYAALTDEQKAEAINTAYTYAKEKAEIAAVPDHLGYSNAWMKAMPKGAEAATIVAKTATASLDKAVDGLKTAWKNGWSDAEDADNLQWAYDTFADLKKTTQADVLGQVDTMTANYLEARTEGITHDEFLDVSKLLSGIKPPRGYDTARTYQKAEAIANTKKLDESEKVLLMKQQLSDSQDKNLDDMLKLGYDAKAYAKVYSLYESIYNSSKSKSITNKKEVFLDSLEKSGVINAKNEKERRKIAEQLYKIFS